MVATSSFIPGSSSNPTSEIELSISCKNLLDCDVFSKSDPMCVIFYKSAQVPEWKEIFRTETINNNTNPNFVKKATLMYHFEVLQELKFSVYDIDSKNPSLESHDPLGSCTATLGQLVSSGTLTLPLKGARPNNKGQLTVHVEELAASRDEVTLEFHGWGLNGSSWLDRIFSFCRSRSPLLEFSKVTEDGTYQVVHRTEVVRSSSNPRWRKFSIPVRSFCGNDYDRDLQVICYDQSDCAGSQTELGRFHVNLRQLSQGPGPETEFLCQPYDKNVQHYISSKRKLRSNTSGRIALVFYEVRKQHTFLDYISSGTQLNCTFAIDFTGSNGDPHLPESLHYINEYYPNQYEQAVRAVGDIIRDYDSDKMFPVLGFGARLPPDGRTSHEFFVNMDPTSPFVPDITGVLEAYKKCIKTVQLYGPTNFSPVINHAAKFAQTYIDGSQYFILLIITDGIITDMEQTKKAIVEASALPLSIIIVGVGQADFGAMDELDGDSVPLSYHGIPAVRDIVQFVPFRNFQNAKDPIMARASLASEVLAEIPGQIIAFMKYKSIEPGSFKR